MDDLQAGQLIEAVRNLTKSTDILFQKVGILSTRMEALEKKLSFGKGLLMGMFLVAGGSGAAVGAVVQRWL